MKLAIVVLSSLMSFVFTTQTQAQVCAAGYSRSERSAVIAYGKKIEGILDEIRVLAEHAAGGLTDDERKLANADLGVSLLTLRFLEDQGLANLSYQSGKFVKDISNLTFLGLDAITLSGNTTQEGQENARNALDSANLAVEKLKVCTHGSWQRIKIQATDVAYQCKPSTDKFAAQKIKDALDDATLVLSDMAVLAHQAANGVYSKPQRRIFDFQLEFLLEELELRGVSRRYAVRSATRSFLKSVIDPTFLGVADISIAGNDISSSQSQARKVVDQTIEAIAKLQGCGGKQLVEF